MDKVLQQLLENEVLDEDTKASLREAWENKIADVRKEATTELREEFSQRYNEDKRQLVEAMDKFLNDQLQTELTEFSEDRNQVKRQQTQLAKQKIKFEEASKKRLRNQVAKIDEFITKTVAQELREFNEDRRILESQRNKAIKQLKESKKRYRSEAADRINTLESFIVKQLGKEINELHEDRRLLADQRVKLVKEGKGQLLEAKQKFLKRASSVVDTTINQTLVREMSQFKDDLKIARENNFGRRIFEAVAEEFMSSHLSEGTKIKSATKLIDQLKDQLQESSDIIKDQQLKIETGNAKVKLAEDKAQRVAKLGKLLEPLGKDQKSTMHELLENVKTERLDEQFKRYLPTVLERKNSIQKPIKADLLESNKQRETVITSRKQHTGDIKNRLTESIQTESNQSEEETAQIIELKALAGLK